MSGTTRARVIVLSDADVPATVALQHAAESTLEVNGGDAACVIPTRPSLEVTLRRQAAATGAELLRSAAFSTHEPDLLLALGREAVAMGATRVVWPAHAGIAGDPEEIDLDRAAAIANTALLVERLLEIELAQAPTIDAPFADLCDRQIAELAIDLGLLPGEVWWARRSNDEELHLAERWTAAFDAAGVRLSAVPASQAETRRG